MPEPEPDPELPSARDIFAAAAESAPVGCDVSRLSQVDAGQDSSRPGEAPGRAGTATPTTAEREEPDEPMTSEAIMRQAAARAIEKQQKQMLRRVSRASFADTASLVQTWGEDAEGGDGDEDEDDEAGAPSDLPAWASSVNGASGASSKKKKKADGELDLANVDYVIGPDGQFKLVPKKGVGERPANADKAGGAGIDGRRGGIAPKWSGPQASAPGTGRRRSSAASYILQRVGFRGRATQEGLQQFARTHERWESGQPTGGVRLVAFKVQRSTPFRTVVLLAVLASAFFLATEYPTDESKEGGYFSTELSLNAVFTLEFLIKLVALGPNYFRSGWNLLDVTVLVNGWAIVALEYIDPDRFVRTLKLLKLARVLRPLRALSIIPALREIINATLAAVRDLGSTLLIISFFLTVFATFLSALFSGLLRRRCYDLTTGTFYEDPSLICTTYETIGRQCTRPNSTCVDSGFGPYAQLDGKAPFFLSHHGHPPRETDANPPYTMGFDNIGWSILSVFVVWAGVGWTNLMYHVGDSQGRGYEGLFIGMHILGAWVLVNLLVAALGTSFERETAIQKKKREEAKQTRIMLLGEEAVAAESGSFVRKLNKTMRSMGLFGRKSRAVRTAERKQIWKGLGKAAVGREVQETVDLFKTFHNNNRRPSATAKAHDPLAARAVDHLAAATKKPVRRTSWLPGLDENSNSGGGGGGGGGFLPGVPAAASSNSQDTVLGRAGATITSSITSSTRPAFASPPPSPPPGGGAALAATFAGYEHTEEDLQALARTQAMMVERETSYAIKNKKGRARRIVTSMLFRTMVVVVITASTLATAVDGPYIKAQYGMGLSERGLRLSNNLFGSLFWLEMLFKLVAFGPKGYCSSILNLFDMFTNLLFLTEVTMRALDINPTWVAQLKVFRMVRIFKLAATTPSFRSLVGKMGNSISAVQSMLVVLIILIFFVATTSLHLFHNMYDEQYGGECVGYEMGANSTVLHSDACTRKPRHHFDNIYISYATVFQVMTTDNWVVVMWDTYNSAGNLALLLFPAIIIVGNFITLNIFLAILLSTFSAASKIEAKQKEAADEAEAEAAQEAARAAAAITADADLLQSALDAAKKKSKRLSKAGKGVAAGGGRSSSPGVGGSTKDDSPGGSPNASPAMTRSGSRMNLAQLRSEERRKQQAKYGNTSVSSKDLNKMAAKEASSSPSVGGLGGLGASNPANRLQAEAAAAAQHLGPDMTLRATKVFLSHDEDKSGAIDMNEMQSCLRELGLDDRDENMLEIMTRYDLDGNNQLDLSEFLMLVRDTPAAPPTALGRFLYGQLPPWMQETEFVRKWVDGAARRAAQADRRRAAERGRLERHLRKIKRSYMRARTSKYGALNAWEVAYLSGEFARADIDGDGFLGLDDVYELLAKVNEEPQSHATWDVLDANSGRDDLISRDEFLVFVSIKRTDDAALAERHLMEEADARKRNGGNGASSASASASSPCKDGGAASSPAGKHLLPSGSPAPKVAAASTSSVMQGMNPDRPQPRSGSEEFQLRRNRAKARARHRSRFAVWRRRLRRLSKQGWRVYLDRLPTLGEFALDGLGEERARWLQRLIFSTYFWWLEIIVIVTSAVLVTSEIDEMVRDMRLNAGFPSLSSERLTPSYLVAASDSAFMIITAWKIVVRLLTEGFRRSLTKAWSVLDIICLSTSVSRLVFTSSWRRTLLSFASLRIFMLLPRFRELKLLSESILRALPNVVATILSLMVIWLMFAILGVSLFGGGTSQCALLNATSGIPMCGVDFGSESYTDPIACRYAINPLPPPPDVVPGVTNSSQCGCVWVDGDNHCQIIEGSDGASMMWVRSFPNFDDTGNALLALMQIATLDGWANLMHFSMDVTKVDHQPAREASFFVPIVYYLLFIIFGVLFATNVFVGVVIDEFNKIRRLYDGSATLTEEQLRWVNTQKLMLRLEPEKKVTYEPTFDRPKARVCFRLVHDEEQLGRPANAPVEARYYGKPFERGVCVLILLNIIALFFWTDPMGEGVYAVYESLNYAFVVIFLIEALIKIVAQSFREYMRNHWNIFDFALVVFSTLASVATVLATLMGYSLNSDFGMAMRWTRCVRALRILRLASLSPTITKILTTLFFALPSIANISIAVFLFTSAYSQFGMAFLGTLVYDYDGYGFSRHANFETAFRAFSALVRMSTGDSWSLLFADAIHNPHVPGIEPPMAATVYFFFVFYMAFMQWVLISIFVAVILEYFNETTAEQGVAINYEDILGFQRKWLEFDVQSTSYIRTIDLGLLLYACKPPIVSVKAPPRDGSFFEAARYVRPNLAQLEELLLEYDIPEHDGSVHFLEVLLALIQKQTGIINEQQIMQKLLLLHPQYVSTIKKMPSITGSTADMYVKDEIMAHLRRGLEATGLADAVDSSGSFKNMMHASGSFVKRGLTRSFTRKRNVAGDSAELERQQEEAMAKRRGSLSRVATSNQLMRKKQEELHAKEKTRRASMQRRGSSSILTSVLAGVGVQVVDNSQSGGGAARRRSSTTGLQPPRPFLGSPAFDPLSA